MILQYRESAFPTSEIPAVYARREGNRHFLLGLTTAVADPGFDLRDRKSVV